MVFQKTEKTLATEMDRKELWGTEKDSYLSFYAIHIYIYICKIIHTDFFSIILNTFNEKKKGPFLCFGCCKSFLKRTYNSQNTEKDLFGDLFSDMLSIL